MFRYIFEKKKTISPTSFHVKNGMRTIIENVSTKKKTQNESVNSAERCWPPSRRPHLQNDKWFSVAFFYFFKRKKKYVIDSKCRLRVLSYTSMSIILWCTSSLRSNTSIIYFNQKKSFICPAWIPLGLFHESVIYRMTLLMCDLTQRFDLIVIFWFTLSSKHTQSKTRGSLKNVYLLTIYIILLRSVWDN